MSGNLGGLALFRSQGLSFQYPTQWREHPPFPDDPPEAFATPITYLSSYPLSDPCTRTTTETVCYSGKVPVGGIRVSWDTVHLPRPSGAAQLTSPNTTIANRDARVTITKGDCGPQPSESIVAGISRPEGDLYGMSACLRGPGLARSERQVLAMLSSTRISH